MKRVPVGLFCFGRGAVRHPMVQGGFTGGYRDRHVDEDVYRITFSGNAYGVCWPVVTARISRHLLLLPAIDQPDDSTIRIQRSQILGGMGDGPIYAFAHRRNQEYLPDRRLLVSGGWIVCRCTRLGD
jgi:hypothetical protein